MARRLNFGVIQLRKKIIILLISLIFGTLVLFFVQSNRQSPLPKVSEIEFVNVILFNYNNNTHNKQYISYIEFDKNNIYKLYKCVTPIELSEDASDFIKAGPIIGEIGFKKNNGSFVWLKFADAGKNPLCFNIDGKSYIRGGANYNNYKKDHIDNYSIDSINIDESMELYKKIVNMYKDNKNFR